MLLFFQFHQPGHQNLHGHLFILMLAAFVLAGYHDVGWQMGNSDSRVRLVDVLTAGAAASISIDAQIFRINIDRHIVLYFRHHF